MNLKGRYTLVGGVTLTVLIVYFMPFGDQGYSKYNKQVFDCNSLLDDINSLPGMMRDMVVMNSNKIGNKSFNELQLEKLKLLLKEVKEQSDGKMASLKNQEDFNLGRSKDWVFDCVSWNVLERKQPGISWRNINETYKPTKNNVKYYTLNKRLPLIVKNSTFHNFNLIATLHVIITKVKHIFKLDSVTILDIFCGELTWMADFLKTRSDIHYTGIDSDEKIVHKNRNKFKGDLPLAEFFVYDATERKIWEKFDIVIVVGVLHWLEHSEHILNMFYHISQSESSFLLMAEDPTTLIKRPKGTTADKLNLTDLDKKPYLLEPPVCVKYYLKKKSVILWSLPLKQGIL